MANWDTAFSDASKALKVWFETPLGQAFCAREQQVIESLAVHAFGHYSVHLGPGKQFLSKMLGNFQCSLSLQPDMCLYDLDTCWRRVIFHPDQLPLANGSTDLVVIHHGLDISHNPHQLLREVARIIAPGGRVIIAGFNPLSSWGLWRLLRFKMGVPWGSRFLQLRRLQDWLNLLSFQQLACCPFFFNLPISRASRLQSDNVMEQFCSKRGIQLGAGYVLSAVKLQTRVHLLRPRWQPVMSKPRFSLVGANATPDYEAK